MIAITVWEEVGGREPRVLDVAYHTAPATVVAGEEGVGQEQGHLLMGVQLPVDEVEVEVQKVGGGATNVC